VRAKGSFEGMSMWGPLFPKGAPLNELPATHSEVYREWTQARVSQAPSTLVFKPAFVINGNNLEAAIANFPVFATGYISESIEGFGTSQSWPTSPDKQFTEKVATTDRMMFAPASLTSAGFTRVLFVFPETLKVYRVLPPARLYEDDFTKHPKLEIDLNVLKLESYEYRSQEKMLLIFVEPTAARAVKDGVVVWAGAVTKIPASADTRQQ
jgi:hypothetical protein